MAFWAALAPAIASMLGGASSSAINNATAKDGSMGYDMPMMTPSPNDAINQQMMSQLAQQQMLNSMAGQLAPGVDSLLARIKTEQIRMANEQMYGRPGQRGGSIMDNTINMASKGNVGPKAMMAQGSRAMQDHASRIAQIQNYIDSLNFTGLMNNQSQAFQNMRNIPRSNEIPYTGNIVKMNTPVQPGMDIGWGQLDWKELLANKANEKTYAGQYDPMGGGTFTGNTINYGGETIPTTVPPQRILSQFDELGRRR